MLMRLYDWLLRKSGMFRAWYMGYMADLYQEVIYDIELMDLDGKEALTKKYLRRLRKLGDNLRGEL